MFTCFWRCWLKPILFRTVNYYNFIEFGIRATPRERKTMSNKVHPAPPDALSQIVNALAAVKPDDYEALKERLLENAGALRTLAGAGFAPPDSEQDVHGAQLPPELMGFTILKDMPGVAAALAKPSFVAAQKAVQDSLNDESALAALQSEVMAVQAAYKDAINVRVQEENTTHQSLSHTLDSEKKIKI